MNFADQPWTTMRDALASGRPVAAILPCGATEAHGPHLPLNTDVIISEGIARRAAVALAESDVRAFVLPPIAYAPAEFASAYAGTITLSTMAMKLLLIEIAGSLKAQGFACLGIANSHSTRRTFPCFAVSPRRFARGACRWHFPISPDAPWRGH